MLQLAPAGSQCETQAQGRRHFLACEVVVFVVIPLIDVETLATWVVTLVVKAVAIIRVTREAVVTCGHEVSHGTGITESEEIPTEVGVVFFLGKCGSRG
jgi:hypothetical protein